MDMQKIGFDNQQYLTTQSEQIRRRIDQFGGKLYLEFGGKLFDDYQSIYLSAQSPFETPQSRLRVPAPLE